ncbi:ELMO/CED-12 family protein [Prunus dulcis]|uniref:ELMO/CED-12 family protein n=1 Tax=Prunus dulcis TaxID=3755 RepID=A0A5H2XMX5_PRUDU|nr:ELMO/CED-12 family protein [Prunus dulcis]
MGSEERMRRLKRRMKVYFDAARADHQEALRALWYATYPGQELQGLISDQWKRWDGREEIHLLISVPIEKAGRKAGCLEYPFAVAGVNITFMIMQMLDLEAKNEWSFDLLYCVAFMVMDKQWLERNATYMEFNDVLKSTRAQLERELLMDDVFRIEDMPSYSLLC